MATPEESSRANDTPKVAGASSSRDSLRSRELEAPATLGDPWEFFNPYTEIDIRDGGNLPHWEQGSVWYFITFRLADALPKEVIDKIEAQRAEWKRSHAMDRLSDEEKKEYHRLFSERYEALLNAGHGSCLLRESENARIVENALHFFDRQCYELDEYIIMPNHVHLLVKPLTDHELVDILDSWKSFTANKINRRVGRSGQLWQHESYDHIVRNERAMQAIRRYIIENPKAK
jgi:REP element-mobilizing transposase RayT